VSKSPSGRVYAAIAVNIACLIALAVYVALMSTPASEATRLRNALLIHAGSAADFQWTPQAVPAGFLVEHLPASPRYRQVIDSLGIDHLPTDWDKALGLADHLTRNARNGGPIQSTLDEAYEQIVRNGKGYCADFTQVYLGLAHAAHVFAREWGFSVDGFGGSGHAFIEVFDRQRGRWIWLDVFNNVHAVDVRTGEPVSALALRKFLSGDGGELSIRPNGPGRLGYKDTSKLIEYYRRGANEWYLWWGNAVFAYEQNMLVRAGQHLLPAIGQMSAIALGLHPRILVVADQSNDAQLRNMLALRIRLLVVVGTGLLLLASLTVLTWRVLNRAGLSTKAHEPHTESIA
jgi:hypothetical protein